MKELANTLNKPTQDTEPRFKEVTQVQMETLCYLALVRLAERYACINAREISREIGRVAADIIEPEFAVLDRRNLIERKKFLEEVYDNIQKLKLLDDYEQRFIENGSDAIHSLGYNAESLLGMGVPFPTLKAAKII